MRYEQSANQSKGKRLAAQAHFQWTRLMTKDTPPEQLAAAAEKLRESVRVGQ